MNCIGVNLLSPGIAFVLSIALIPILLLLVLVFCFVVADGIVSEMDKKPSETERIVKEIEAKVKIKLKRGFVIDKRKSDTTDNEKYRVSKRANKN